MKKIALTLAITGLAVSAVSNAAMPTSSGPFQVSMPNITPGFDFTVSGVYLRPDNNGLYYTSSSVTSNGATTNVAKNVDPDNEFGFALGAGYTFANSSNDVQLLWNHLDTGTYSSTYMSTTTTFNNGTAEFKLDTVDLNAGQFVDFGTRLRMRFAAGLRFVQLKRNFDINSGTISSGTQVLSAHTGNYSKMTGLGPRLNIDSSYYVTNGFGVVAGVGVGALASTISANQTVLGYTSGTVTSTTYNVPDDLNRVVPEIDGKLGVNYSRPFNSSILTLEAGYQASYYSDAVGTASSTNNVGSDTGFHGPYLTFNWKV